MSFINENYSSVNEDEGYGVLRTNQLIDSMFPYKPDMEPRLVRFLRAAYSHKVHGIKPCVPLEMEYHIVSKDWNCIRAYLKKYVYRG